MALLIEGRYTLVKMRLISRVRSRDKKSDRAAEAGNELVNAGRVCRTTEDLDILL